jgi:hypothetical protein
MSKEHNGTPPLQKTKSMTKPLQNLKIELSTSIKMKQDPNAKSPKLTSGLIT